MQRDGCCSGRFSSCAVKNGISAAAESSLAVPPVMEAGTVMRTGKPEQDGRRHAAESGGFIGIVLTVLLSGCAAFSPFDRDLLQHAAAGKTPIEMVDVVPRRTGEAVLWGGRIADVRVLERELEIGVLAFPLDAYGEPEDEEAFQGRFAARYPITPEAYRYGPGRLITIHGRVDSFEEIPIGQGRQTVPVVVPIQTELWDVPTANRPGLGWWPFWHVQINVMGGF